MAEQNRIQLSVPSSASGDQASTSTAAKPTQNNDADTSEENQSSQWDLCKRQGEFFETMNAMRHLGQLCDTSLVVEGERIPVHRLVLSACSAYFRAMFTSNMAEANSKEVPLHEVNVSTVKAIVDFAYTAQINLDDDNVQELLSAANRYQIEPIKEECSRYLMSQLSADNCLGIRDFANYHNCCELLATAVSFIDAHFGEVYETEEFLTLEPDAVKALLKRDALTVSSEDEVRSKLDQLRE